jgi:GNAT superfamily N-acetyltransferase
VLLDRDSQSGAGGGEGSDQDGDCQFPAEPRATCHRLLLFFTIRDADKDAGGAQKFPVPVDIDRRAVPAEDGRMKLVIRPLTPDLWPALEDLFGRSGASNGCWCMYWRLGPAYHERPRAENKAAFRALVRRGPPPGLLAFDGDRAVGWCQLTPRAALPWLDRVRLVKRVDDVEVWSLSCFYVRRGYRRRGVSAALIAAAVKAAKRAGAPALEAYPVDTGAPKSTSNLFTGTAATFARAGFKAVARPAPHRPTMRHDLRGARR